MKKTLSLALSFVIAVTLVACAATTSELPASEAPPSAAASVEAAASKSTEPSKDVTIGVVTKVIDPFFQNLIDHCVARGEELGINVIYSAAANVTAVEEQIAIVQDMISKKVDALIVVPIDSKALVSAVVDAEKAGIPVISFDNQFDKQTVEEVDLPPIPFVGIDNQAAAYQSAQYLVDKLGGQGKCVILEGVTGADNATLRAAGAKQAFDEADGIELVASQAADWDTEKAYAVMSNILQANPDITGVFSSADPMAYGALKAIEDAGLKDKILVASFDGNIPAIEMVASGELLCTLDQNAPKIAAKAVDVAMEAIEGKEMQPLYMVDPILVTADNCQSFLS